MKYVTRNNIVLKKNPLIHVFKKGRNCALYNPFNQQVVYGEQSLVDFLDEFKEGKNVSQIDKKYLRHVDDLTSSEILVGIDFDEQKEFKKAVKAVFDKIGISLMYLIITDECNFACKYCFEKGNKRYSRPMDKSTIVNAMDFLQKLVDPKEKVIKIVLYGGEPLLEKDLVKFIIIDEKQRIQSLYNIDIQFEIITNGSCITEEIAKIFFDNNVNVSVSLDGWENLHNYNRIGRNAKPTFNHAIRGFKTLKCFHCEPGISCTVTHDNINFLDEIVRYFSKELKPSAIGINPQLDKNFSPGAEKVSSSLIKAFEAAREEGLYEDRIMKLIKPFVEQYVSLGDCGAYGNQIIIFPNGDIGCCHALNNKENIIGNINDNLDAENIYENNIFKQWANRSPFSIESCKNCPAISICGGGCAYSAIKENGDINIPDKYHCILSLSVLEWAIWKSIHMVKSS